MNTFKSQLTIWSTFASYFNINQKTLETFERRLKFESHEFVTVILPLLGKDIDRSLSSGHLIVTSRFKKQRGTELPCFMYELFTKAYTSEGYLKDGSHETIRALRQLTYIFYKLETDFTDEQSDKAFKEFKTLDNDVKTSEWPDTLNIVRQNFQSLLPDDPMDIKPRHTSGVPYPKVKNSQKRRQRTFSPAITKVFGVGLYFQSLSHSENWASDNKVNFHTPVAKVTLVPKDSRGPRKICQLPHETTFLEAGLSDKIVEHVERHSPAKGYVNFTDQGINRDLARIGSKTGRFATIDLKDASDLVSWDLVRLLSPLEWVAVFAATRTCHAELQDGEIIPLRKFAPMGSALCFPIEAMIFWSIARTVTKRVWVYGDDIICEAKYAEQVVSALESYGMQINKDKTLITGPFKESCGGEYLAGEDISIIRLKSLNDVISFVSTCNLITRKYSEKLSEDLIPLADQMIGGGPILRQPISDLNNEEPLVFYTERCSGNVLLEHRWNKKLHRVEVRSLRLEAKSVRDRNLADYDSLYEWFCTNENSTTPFEDSYLRSLDLNLVPAFSRRTRSTLVEPKGATNSWSSDTRIKFGWGMTNMSSLGDSFLNHPPVFEG